MHCLDGSQRPLDAVNSLTICFSAGKIYLPQSCRPRRQPSPDFQMAVIRNSHALSLGRRYLLIYSHLMPTFYRVAGALFVLGLAMISFVAPWTSTPVATSGPRNLLGYAPLWSGQFSAVPGARVDFGGFAILACVVAFFAIII